MEGVENAVSLSSWERECFFEYIYIYIYLYIYKKLSLKKIAECDRNKGGLKGNCFLSSFVIKMYIYIDLQSWIIWSKTFIATQSFMLLAEQSSGNC